MVRWTEEDLAQFQANSGRPIAKAAADEIAKHKRIAKLEARARAMAAAGDVRITGSNKYSAVATVVDGIRFDSKLEARRYNELVTLRKWGEVSFFLRQVPFHLPGGVIYRVDFAVYRRVPGPIEHAFQVKFEDCKGFQRQDSKNKIKQVEALYGVQIELIRAASKGIVR